jgi:hypothetical protein
MSTTVLQWSNGISSVSWWCVCEFWTNGRLLWEEVLSNSAAGSGNRYKAKPVDSDAQRNEWVCLINWKLRELHDEVRIEKNLLSVFFGSHTVRFFGLEE